MFPFTSCTDSLLCISAFLKLFAITCPFFAVEQMEVAAAAVIKLRATRLLHPFLRRRFPWNGMPFRQFNGDSR